MIRLFRSVGGATLGVAREVGAATIFAAQGVVAAFSSPLYFSQLARQLAAIGYYSLPVVGLTAIFIGAALALNIYAGGARFNAEQFVPQIVVLGIVRELGPVLAGLMLAGRVSAGLAAEIGTMRVTEQIDAMSTLSTDPMRFLVAPRLLAGVITMPLIVLVANIIGVMGGFLVATGSLGFNGSVYLRNTINFIEASDIFQSMTKAAVFGFIIALMGCYHGDRSKGGALGVGRAATSAVVSATVLILAANYVVTSFWVDA